MYTEDDEQLADAMMSFFIPMFVTNYVINRRERRQVNIPANRGLELVHVCFTQDHSAFQTCRMDCRCLRMLTERCVGMYGLGVDRQTTVEEQMVISLVYLAHGGSMGALSIFFGHSKSTISRIFQRVLECLLQLYTDEVTPIDQNVIHYKMQENNARSLFKDCIGAIDGTHVRVHPPAAESVLWRGRSNQPTTNVIGICDHDMLFTYFIAGAEGAMHDAAVLDRVLSEPEFLFPHPNPGKYYLVDAGYRNINGYLAPYRQTRYHPHQFLPSQQPSNEKEAFNKQHSSIRSVIERTFGIWKNKWHITFFPNTLRGFKIKKQIEIITATAGLHNFVRRNMHVRGNDRIGRNCYTREGTVLNQNAYDDDVEENLIVEENTVDQVDMNVLRNGLAFDVFTYGQSSSSSSSNGESSSVS